MRVRVEARNATVDVEDGRILAAAGACDATIRVPDGDLRPGLINAHDHLHRNHYGRLGHPPYDDAYAWGRDIHERDAVAIAAGRAWPRRRALLEGAWKNLFAGVTTVVHHDAWDEAFDDTFPIRVARLRTAHSLRFETSPGAWVIGTGPFAIHLAEGTNRAAADEVRELADRGLVTPDLLAVHVVGVDDDGVRLLRDRASAVVWCPASNLFLFGVTAPPALLADGMDVLLGTDSMLTGSPSLLDELRCARGLGCIADARLEAAVGPVAARRLGLPGPTIAIGATADLCILRAPLLDATIADVALVMVGGEIRLMDPLLAPQLGTAGAMGQVATRFGVARWVCPDGVAARDGRAGQ